MIPQMTVGAFLTEEIEPTDYIAIGLATWFRRTEGEDMRNKLEEVRMIEPISSGSLEVIAGTGTPTSYSRVAAMTMGELSDCVEELPSGLVEGYEDSVLFAEDFGERALASARTYRRKPDAKELLKIGNVSKDLNYSTEKRRMLDESWEPNFEDNVKQDRSIDVYGRGESDEKKEAATEIEIDKLYTL